MTPVQIEIAAQEERLREAELGPDLAVFEELLADDVVLVGQDGKPGLTKSQVVQAHQPGKGPKFLAVAFNNLNIVDHGSAAVATCEGVYQTAESTVTLQFMRFWLKRAGRWQIVAASVND
jgi:hypothetical protein